MKKVFSGVLAVLISTQVSAQMINFNQGVSEVAKDIQTVVTAAAELYRVGELSDSTVSNLKQEIEQNKPTLTGAALNTANCVVGPWNQIFIKLGTVTKADALRALAIASGFGSKIVGSDQSAEIVKSLLQTYGKALVNTRIDFEGNELSPMKASWHLTML